MSQTLSRQELSRVFCHKNSVYLAIVGLFCLTIASFSFHLSFGVKFLKAEMLLPWAAIHGLSFLSLLGKKWHRLLMPVILVTFQLYCVSVLREGGAYIPLAPAFFVVCTVLVAAQTFWPRTIALVLWLALWMGVFFWSGPSGEIGQREWFARTTVIFGSLIFLVSFMLIAQTTFNLTKKIIKSFGPQESFDEPRIHSARLHVIGEIAASLLHEIANPITNIGGYNFQIKEEIKDRKIENEILSNATERIAFNVERTRDIIDALKNFSKHKVKVEVESFELSKMFKDTLFLVQHHIRRNGVEFQSTLPDHQIFLKGNNVEVGQVIVNLLTNALHVVSAREGEKRIELNYIESSKWVEVYVVDNGGGVPGEIIDKIFDPFFTTKGDRGGTGLGLYISSIIADRNNAELDYKPVKDLTGRTTGARFSLKMQKLNQNEESSEAA